MDPDSCPSPDQSCMVCSSVASAERTASASTGPGQWLGEVCCSHIKEEELSCLLPPMEVPSSLCQESIISWLLFKGSHSSDSVQATAVMSVPKLRRRDLHKGEAAWWQAEMAFGCHAYSVPKGNSSSLPLLTIFEHHENMVLWQMLVSLWKASARE